MSEASKERGKIFPTTDWSLFEQCQTTDLNGRTRQEQVLAIYLPALRSYLRAVRRCRAEEADELVQSFAAAKLVEGSIIEDARRDKGRFRTYLLTIFQRFLTDTQRRSDVRQRQHQHYAEQTAQVSSTQHNVDPFDLAWARSLLNEVAHRMERHLLGCDRGVLWQVFQRRILSPILTETEVPPYETMVREFGFDTPTQACSAVVTARRMFARTLRHVIGEYADSEEEIDQELNDLREILSGAR